MTMIQTGTVTFNSSGPPVTNSGDLSNFTQVNFPTPFPGGSNVVVIPMVQTFSGADTPGVRIGNVTTTGFRIRMNELVVNGGQALSDGNHIAETIGWIAFSVS